MSSPSAPAAAKMPETAGSLRALMGTGVLAAAPVFAVLLMCALPAQALSLAGGSSASLASLAIVRLIVDGASKRKGSARAASSAEMAAFGIATLVKFVAVTVLVFVMYLLKARMIWLLVGFTITQVAVAIKTARGSMTSAQKEELG